ncbi:MAG: hypothetical protein PHP37_01735 [Patescibacteria group bacterium]|nr:hypothetical protein [Patescibacteria group bacterium]
MDNKKEEVLKNRCFHLISVDMGYGHQRAAYPFIASSCGGVITANDYLGASLVEKKIWNRDRKNYELISRFKKVPLLGDKVFSLMDYFQRIDSFYPRRDLSKTNIQQQTFFRKVKNGLGKNLIEELNKDPLPILTTFFVAVYFAEYYNYKGQVYCIICDADISRAWAPVDPAKSNTIYLAPNQRVKERLMLYGVKEMNIYVTGFPLPKENIGDEQLILKEDLRKRLAVLDPNSAYRNKYEKLIENYLCPKEKINGADRPPTLTFAVGGAGAQKELGKTILESLKNKIEDGKIRLNLVAGSRPEVYEYFSEALKDNFLNNNENVKIIYDENKIEYFKKFNIALRTTDILWTKPSELSFYSGLGLPIIMAEPVGSQEHYNRRWLLGIGAGVDSKNPKYTNEWLFDFIDSGWLAEAAMMGFLNAPKMGTYNIENIILKGRINEIERVRIM